MNNEKRVGIIALAVAMFIVTVISAQVTGQKSSFYYWVWVMVGYYGYKGNLSSIKTLMYFLMWFNFIVACGLVLFLNNYDKWELIISVGVMMIPKFLLYGYCKEQLEQNSIKENNSKYDSLVQSNSFEKENSIPSSNTSFTGRIAVKNNVLEDKKNTVLLKGKVEMEKNDEEFWERALNEYEGSDRKKGLWAKLFAEHNGDDQKIKIQYLKIRVEQLTQESSLISNKKLETLPEDNFNLEAESSKAKHPQEYKNIEDYIISGIYLTKPFMDNEYYLYPNGQAAVKWNDELRVYSDEFYVQSALKVYVRSGILPVVGFVRKIEIQGK